MRKILATIAFMFLFSPAEAAYLDLVWDPNTEPDLAGYNVYYGTESENYAYFIDVGITTTYRLDGLLDGVAYYIAVTAYDTSDNESDCSNEVSGVETTEPTPDIKANGSDGPITVSSASPVSITVSLDPGDKVGQNADWWIIADTPNGLYSYVHRLRRWSPGIHLCAQAPLIDLPLTGAYFNIPPGDYTVYFAVDDNADGNLDATWEDSVELDVQDAG